MKFGNYVSSMVTACVMNIFQPSKNGQACLYTLIPELLVSFQPFIFKVAVLRLVTNSKAVLAWVLLINPNRCC